MQVTIDNIHYTFIPNKISSFQKSELVLKNDIYEKYKATGEVEGELVVCKDASNVKRFEKKVVRETFDEYTQAISQRPIQTDAWIYNIIHGVAEQASVLYRDDQCVVIPTYMWDGTNIDKLHILCLPTNITLRCIRSLTAEHIPLLEHMRRVTCDRIRDQYGVDETGLKIFFHYEPSTYHLHIHFINVAHRDACSSVEYSHDLYAVLFNLSICSDYYQRAILHKRA
ncbi:MAG: hypothetical protein ACOVRN_10445 [Flavobacterium sp.]